MEVINGTNTAEQFAVLLVCACWVIGW